MGRRETDLSEQDIRDLPPGLRAVAKLLSDGAVELAPAQREAAAGICRNAAAELESHGASTCVSAANFRRAVFAIVGIVEREVRPPRVAVRVRRKIADLMDAIGRGEVDRLEP